MGAVISWGAAFSDVDDWSDIASSFSSAEAAGFEYAVATGYGDCRYP